MKDIRIILERNYKICYHAFMVTKIGHILHDMNQRMDEICLIYSDYFDVSVIDARDHLQHEASLMIQKEDDALHAKADGGRE